MFDQSFNQVSISRMLKKSDFLSTPRLRNPSIKAQKIEAAIERARQGFSGITFLSETKVKKKTIYRIENFSDELVLRKINTNIKNLIKIPNTSRDTITANIKSLLSEGVAYKIYRLDIKGYYESFDTAEVISTISSMPKLSLLTKRMVKEILTQHISNGGLGVPRGLALSATLSEAMMLSFDKSVRELPGVFFYSRYVDDIIIITSGNESEENFKKTVSELLPSGLGLNEHKTRVCLAPNDVQPYKSNQPPPAAVLSFEFLGYQFTVCEPPKSDNRSPFRAVQLDIAESKVKKIKTRMTRALISYCNNRNFDLLEARFKHLTSNFSVLDADRERKRLAGIFYNYHRIDVENSKALKQLDGYLKKTALSGHGTVFDDFFCKTTVAQRRRLLKFSFERGFREKTFMHFSQENLKLLQECWAYV
ncbi:Phage-related reverse transcriptase/maturase family protein [Azotobacter chroococcum NCIMB 8003]|uniref:Phage-related reverse transcriptase/maturase family protein n=1 Tax=Azotobacter chroococcum NCIMB 8003 TaxID=1328314 RepID=A0A0C4WPD9_9GAMM|nr:Phage-related reverse transcriptase/maturase family protein [Azotobacter chroococcum NCIMB 8003]